MNRELSINLGELFGYLLKRRFVILAVAALIAIATFSVSYFFITPTYESQSMIYITSGQGGGNVVQNMLSSLQAGNALTADYKTLATSKPVLEQVIKDLDLDLTYEQLKAKVETENPDNTRILSLKVRDKDPKTAKKIVDKLTEIERNKIADVMNATAPNVMQWGDIQSDPVSPSPLRRAFNMGVLTVIALSLYFSAKFILYDTVNTSEDIESYLGLQTLAEIPLLQTNTKKKKHRR